MGDTVFVLINEAVKAERASTVNTVSIECSTNRKGRCNMIKNRSVVSKSGRLQRMIALKCKHPVFVLFGEA